MLQAAREEAHPYDPEDPEKGALEATEEPGIDALRGTFGGLGTIIRARRRQSTIADMASVRHSVSGSSMHPPRHDSGEAAREWENVAGRGLRRFQLHDPPMPKEPSPASIKTAGRKRRDSNGSAVAVRGSIALDEPAAGLCSTTIPSTQLSE